MADYPKDTILILKKKHPCGSQKWQVLKPGWEYSIKCLGCEHTVLIKRDKLFKMVKATENNI